MVKQKTIIGIIVFGLLAGLGVYLYREFRPTSARGQSVWAFLKDPLSQRHLMIKAGSRCNDAPFLFPTDGMAGFIWDDSFRPGHRHQGVDIFAGTEVGITPVIAAYSGYLTRKPDWKSSVIVRIPSDPLQPGRQIWVYYTHMADPNGNSFISTDFPPGTSEIFVESGTFLGYQGNYSGDPNNPTGVHLHISIVEDDGFGSFKNELDINNTYDPSPYLGLQLNAHENTTQVPVCE